jgi:cytosine/adenosine deaminase-related metal-dependent hydrolase
MPPAHALLREPQLFAKAGIPGPDIIAAATANAAEKIGKQDTMGTVTVGAAADAVLLDADPLTDIAHLTDPRHRRAGISAGHSSTTELGEDHQRGRMPAASAKDAAGVAFRCPGPVPDIIMTMMQTGRGCGGAVRR